MAKTYGKGKTAIESEDQQKLRWQVELEFVQCLANPNYLNFLAQRGYFKDQAFINYLKYLQYWKEPDYAKYLMYPICLYFLDLLQYEHFRREIVNSQCCKFIDDQAILQWQHYTRKRIKMFDAVSNSSHGNAGEASEPQQQQQQQSQQQQALPQHQQQNGPMSMQNGIGGNTTQQNQGQGQTQQQQQQQQQQLPQQLPAQQQQLNGIAGSASSGLMQKMQ